MNRMPRVVKRVLFTLLAGVLVSIGALGGGKLTPTASAASENGYVFYTSEDTLYRVPAAGGTIQKLAENFEGTDVEATDKYLYFLTGDSSSQLQRLSLTEADPLINSFAATKNIVFYLVEGDFLYFMDSTGKIYRSLANAADDSQIKQIVSNADIEFPGFSVVNGRIYYNALKDGANTWAASKSRDGSGNVQWIAKGAIPSSRFIHPSNNTVSVMVDTKPEETYYSLSCMVLYTLPINGGNAKAVNVNSPLDANATLSGGWSNDYFVYNKGVTVDDDDNFIYSKSKAYAIDKAGKVFQFSQTSVISLSDMGGGKLAYVGSNGKGYVSTVVNGKVTSTKPVELSNVKHVAKFKNGTASGQTVFFATKGAYALNANLTLTKLNGVDWDNSAFNEKVAGIYYWNTEDNDNLYRMSTDGKSKIKLSETTVDSIETISPR
ncbi:DUF5050 domain-containing protein [Paenibacillus sp. HW567]|uniref:DUF5050 domain-containing protein n=1 Tax=Paenibacillus sp. HW567 TaxID=1034769 RepID=UPI00037F1D91|nr:DUF5050 domain-containing protein [Paenibacillus sp. HW567]